MTVGHIDGAVMPPHRAPHPTPGAVGGRLEDADNGETPQHGNTPGYSQAPARKPSSKLRGRACSLFGSHTGIWRATVGGERWWHVCLAAHRGKSHQPTRAGVPERCLGAARAQRHPDPQTKGLPHSRVPGTSPPGQRRPVFWAGSCTEVNFPTPPV